VTVFGVFLTPVFYYVIQWFGSKTKEHQAGPVRKTPANGEAAMLGEPVTPVLDDRSLNPADHH
jgi:hypothetical protein